MPTTSKPRLLLAALTIGVVLLLQDEPGWAASTLENLRCVRIETVGDPDLEKLGIAAKDLEHMLSIEIKAQLPRLPIESHCPDVLRLTVGLVAQSQPTPDRYHGFTALAILRAVTPADVGSEMTEKVWEGRLGRIHGSSDTLKKQVEERVSREVRNLAVAYYEAGNK